MRHSRLGAKCLFLFGTLFLLLGMIYAQTSNPAPSVVITPKGDVLVPAMSVPPSSLLSAEANAYVAQHLKDMQDPSATYQEKGIPRFMRSYLERMKTIYPVNTEDEYIAGVHVSIYTPEKGISPVNQSRVLINLHGGGFAGCWPGCSLLESIPIAAIGGIRVVSVDYRQAPEYKFPAASEDVAKVYAELLRKYDAKSIGIYGCSAGGMLTGMSLAWFQVHQLPMPGAAGIFCAGIGDSSAGDAMYTAMPLGEARMPVSDKREAPSLGYLAGTIKSDPLVFQALHAKVLAGFPPTLILTGTRDFAMSSAIYSHLQLLKAGADSNLVIWDGLFHGFFYNPDVPESKDAYAIILKFFDSHLKGSK